MLSRIFPPLLLFCLALGAATREIIDIPSAVMKKRFKACVFLPRDYGSGSRFSTVYFLHGYGGNHTTWPRVAPLSAYADTCRLIFVCPDGNYNSWYLDSPVKKNSAFETYLIKEVLPFIDRKYRTRAEARGRAIIGTSMGGHGAVTLCVKHPDAFHGGASISGIMDLTEFPGEWDLSGVLGPYDVHQRTWQSYSFTGMVDRLIGTDALLILDCGTSDFALPGNRRAHELLQARRIAHEYYERPGGHTLEYSRECVGQHLLHFKRVLLFPASSGAAGGGADTGRTGG